MQATSPAFMVTTARGLPDLPSLTSQMISSESWMNHSQRSLPCSTGRMNSSVVGQNRLSLTTEHTDGFQVTSERDRYPNRLKADTSCSNPGAAWTSGWLWSTSANMRFTGWVSSVRTGVSPGSPTIRLAVTRCRVTAPSLAPFFAPQGAPVSMGAAKGSYPALVQSEIIRRKTPISSSDSKRWMNSRPADT